MISNRGLALIKKWESCRLTAYDDGTGTWTIGWGHTAGVKQGDTCTQAQADAWLLEDIIIYNNNVQSFDHIYHWTQNEEDALTSFAYNIGSINQLTANGTRTKSEIADKMLLYVNAGGKYMEGLANRRKQERAMFLESGNEGTPLDPDDPSSGGEEDPNLPSGSEYFDRFDEMSARIDYVFSHIGATEYYADAEKPWQKRLPIAQANGIADYTGKSWENRTLELLARAGRLKRPT